MGDERSTVGAPASYSGGRVLSSFHGGWATLCGIMVVVGCLALTWSPLLPWFPDNGYGVTTNGLNAISGGVAALSADTSQAGDGSSDGRSQAVPSLSAIPLTQGGTEASARHGVFVLVLGATALLIAVLALVGEARRRRRMARDVRVLAALALVPLVYDGVEIRNATGGLGDGVTVGVLGALVAILGGAWMYRSLRDAEAAGRV